MINDIIYFLQNLLLNYMAYASLPISGEVQGHREMPTKLAVHAGTKPQKLCCLATS